MKNQIGRFLAVTLCAVMMLTFCLPGLTFAESEEITDEVSFEEPTVTETVDEEEQDDEEIPEPVSEEEPGEPAKEEIPEDPENPLPEETATDNDGETSSENVVGTDNGEGIDVAGEESANDNETPVDSLTETEENETFVIGETATDEAADSVLEETEDETNPDEVFYGEIKFAGCSYMEETEDPEELLNAYAQMCLDSLRPQGGGKLRSPANPTNGFSDGLKTVFNTIRARISTIAANGGSTIITVSFEEGKEPTWTPGQIKGFTGTEFTSENVETAVRAAFSQDFAANSLLQALVNTCVYELYWFDKTKTGGIANGFSYEYSSDYICIPTITYYLGVVDAYKDGTTQQIGEKIMNVGVISDVGTSIQSALDEIQATVSASTGYPTAYEKLEYFKDHICDLVDYNHPAADDDDTPYGNPWQLIWVFDGDPDTKVVCEGYAKAFAYLCDLAFPGENPEIRCYTVSGTMGGGTGSGGHLWNAVKMDDGLNYLVDVTNCDSDDSSGTVSIGYPDLLFLKGYAQELFNTDGKSVGYDYLCNNSNVRYVYKPETMSFYSPAELSMCPWDYGVKLNLTLEVVALDENGTIEELGEEAPVLDGGGEYGYGATITLSAGVLTNHVFDGWYNGESLLSEDMQYSLDPTDPGNLTLTAKYTKVGDIGEYASLTLKDDVSINFYVTDLPDDGNLQEYKVQYSLDGENVQEASLTSPDYNKIVVAHRAAKEMGDEVHIELLYQEQPIYSTDYSVRDYCESQIESSDTPEKLKTLCRTILDYGASSQTYFGYNAGNLVNEKYSSGLVDETVIPAECNVLAKMGSCSDIANTYFSLVLKNKTVLNIYFEPANGATLESLTFTLNGTEVPVGNTGSTVLESIDQGMIRLSVKGFAAKNLNDQVTVTASDGDETQTITYSPMTYAYIKQNASSGLGQVCRAIYLYYCAAADYFA